MLDDPRPRTAVSALGSGGIMVIIAYVLFLFHVDVPAPVVAAITGVLGALGGFLVHSSTLSEDRAALHKLILARLGDPGGARPPVVVVSSPAPPQSAAEMLKAAETSR